MTRNKKQKAKKEVVTSGSATGHTTYIIEVRTKKRGHVLTNHETYHEITNDWSIYHIETIDRKSRYIAKLIDDGHSMTFGKDDIFLPKCANTLTYNSAMAHAHILRDSDNELIEECDIRVRPCTLDYSYEIYKDDEKHATIIK